MSGKVGPSFAPPREVREQILLFTVADEIMGIGIAALKEVIVPEGLKPIEAAGDSGCAEILYRGRRIPVVGLGQLFGYSSPVRPPLRRVLVVGVEGVTLGFLVDSVQEMVEVSPREIESIPAMLTLLDGDYFRGFLKRGDRIIILLNEAGFAKMEQVLHFAGGTQRGGGREEAAA